MNPVFVPDGPALLLEGDIRLLLISDAHFGGESELARRGVHISSNSEKRLERLFACIEQTSPDLLLFLGDVKQSVPVTSWQEKRELPSIFERIRERVPMQVIPGNHDGGIGRFLEEGELLKSEGVLIEDIGFFHGHRYPASALLGHLIICGHHHPVTGIYDGVGYPVRAHPAFVLCETTGCPALNPPEDTGLGPTRFLIMPAFYEFAGGVDVRTIKQSGLSPLARCIDESTAEVMLSDGTYLDTIAGLKATGS